MNDIQWDKVKKSPIPKNMAAEIIGWYRGSGIKIGFTAGRIFITDTDDELLIERYGLYSADMSAKDVKDMAKAMLNTVEQRQLKETVEQVTQASIDQHTAEAEREARKFIDEVQSEPVADVPAIPAGLFLKIADRVGSGNLKRPALTRLFGI